MSETSGYFWHVHHSEDLFEWSDNIEMRIKYIEILKPSEEVETRLRLLRRVVDQQACINIVATRGRLYAEYKANRDTLNAEYKIKLDALCADINALHVKECPGCPWNGVTIFPKEPRRTK